MRAAGAAAYLPIRKWPSEEPQLLPVPFFGVVTKARRRPAPKPGNGLPELHAPFVFRCPAGVFLGFEKDMRNSCTVVAQTDCLVASWDLVDLNYLATGAGPAVGDLILIVDPGSIEGGR